MRWYWIRIKYHPNIWKWDWPEGTQVRFFCIWDTSILRCVSWRSQEWQPDCWSQEDWIEGRRVSWWWNMRAWNLQEKWFCAYFIDGFPQRFNLLFNRSDFIFKIFWFVETFHLTSLAFSINFSLGSLVSLNCIGSVYINPGSHIRCYRLSSLCVEVVLVFTFRRQSRFLYNTALLWDDIPGKYWRKLISTHPHSSWKMRSTNPCAYCVFLQGYISYQLYVRLFLLRDRLVKCEIHIWWVSPVVGASWNTTAKFTHFRRDRCSRKLHFLKEQHFSKQSDNALRSETDPVSRATSWPIGWVMVYKQDCLMVKMTRHRYKLIR